MKKLRRQYACNAVMTIPDDNYFAEQLQSRMQRMPQTEIRDCDVFPSLSKTIAFVGLSPKLLAASVSLSAAE